MRTVSQTSCLNRPMDATQLLAACGDDTSFFLATPTQTLLAQGVQAILTSPDGAMPRHLLPEQVKTLLKQQADSGWPPAPVVGAIPFDDSAAVHLFVPDQLHRAGPLPASKPATRPDMPGWPPCQLRMIPEPASYRQGVEQALEQIQQTELLKVVLSRSLELSFAAAIDWSWLLGNLARDNRYGYTYLIDLARFQRLTPKYAHVCHKLIGASPELLVRRRGLQVEANPLAGSAPRSSDPATNRQRAEALMNSDKDRREHAVVVEAVAATLHPFCHQLEVPPAPSIHQTDSMMHLSTKLRGTLRDPDTCALALALALHPTPAVCGSPPEGAYQAIQAIEPFARRYFTGMVGWVDAQGDGEWAVTIRCGEAEGSRLRLYAGAGVVAGSTPAQELAETSAKFRTMLQALGLTHLLEVTA